MGYEAMYSVKQMFRRRLLPSSSALCDAVTIRK